MKWFIKGFQISNDPDCFSGQGVLRHLLLFTIIGVVLAGVIWLPLLHASFDSIDDHFIVSLLTKPFGFFDISHAWLNTDAGRPFVSLVNRPGYDLFLVIESYLWGANPFYWHLIRIIIFLFAFVVGCIILNEWFGWIATLLVVSFEVTHVYWFQMVGVLCMSESYALFGMALMLLGLFLRYKGMTSRCYSPWIIIGLLIAISAKENFLIFTPIAAWLLWKDFRITGWFEKGGYLLVCLCGLFIASSVCVALYRSGTDVYMNPIGLSHRSVLIVRFFSDWKVMLWCVGTLFFGAMAWFKQRGAIVMRVDFRAVFVWLGMFLVIDMLQYIFYNGAIHGRYKFPYSTIEHLAILIGMTALFGMIRPFLSRRVLLIGAITVAVGCGVIVVRHANMLMYTSYGYAERTNRWYRLLDNTEKAVAKDRSRNIILVSDKVMQFEPLLSMQQFLRYRGVLNPISIKMAGYSPTDFASSTLSHYLAVRLLSISMHGGGQFVPLKSADAHNCVAILFGHPTYKGTCADALSFWHPDRKLR